MDKKSIAQEIHKRVKNSETVDYSMWTIGLTHDLQARKKQHKNDGESIKYWNYWKANSLSGAQEVENYFINEKNMDGGAGGDLSAHKTTYVYIF